MIYGILETEAKAHEAAEKTSAEAKAAPQPEPEPQEETPAKPAKSKKKPKTDYVKSITDWLTRTFTEDGLSE